MIALSLPIVAWVMSTLQLGVFAVPTWPSSVDELEDIMLLNSGYRSRGFSAAVTPCSFSAQGAGRVAAAEWIRTAFHDMATGNAVQGIGGLDASLVFETNGGENIGPAFNTTLTTYAPFFSSRSSMSDIIAMGMYTAVRSCGGPVVAIRTGRIDATKGGDSGVPLPQNGITIFQNQFLRMGFNTTEMIAVVACGHTMGGVHSSNFPEIVPVASAANSNGVKDFDTTQLFDNKVATEYVSGTTLNPLVVGPSIAKGENSDGRVFAADGNVTIKALTNLATFTSVCSTMLQKMIEVVPKGTVLTDPIVPYEVKPYALQLTLLAGGANISFTGDIRIRTTIRAASQVASVQIVYKDRDGNSASDNIDTTYKGTANGFDDSFTFYGFSANLAASSSISSFNVLVTLIDGSTELHDNNGAGFPIQDTIMLQSPQSCLSSTNDTNGQRSLTVIAAVRNTGLFSVQLQLTLKIPRTDGIIVPTLSTVSAAMASQTAIGSYNLYAATYSLDPSQTQTTSFGVSAGSSTDNYKNVTLLPSTCAALSPTAPSSTPSSSAFAFQGCYTDSSASRAYSAAVFYDNNLTVEKCALDCSKFQYFGVEFGGECYCGNSRDPSSTRAGISECNVACSGNTDEYCGGASRISAYKNLNYAPVTNPTIAGYTYQGCFSEAQGGRALADSSTATDGLTVESCASFCGGSTYFGVEYGRECYCGASLATTSTNQSASDCSMTCAGNSLEYCGAGNRLNIY
ncbi:WSC domain-containing protein 2, partial [Mytilinidion resinicola]